MKRTYCDGCGKQMDERLRRAPAELGVNGQVRQGGRIDLDVVVDVSSVTDGTAIDLCWPCYRAAVTRVLDDWERTPPPERIGREASQQEDGPQPAAPAVALAQGEEAA